MQFSHVMNAINIMRIKNVGLIFWPTLYIIYCEHELKMQARCVVMMQ